ncbi:AMP-binding protein [Thalassotalea aquiviva]|uniref:AMP-binding protein n=1 Tax=Thalassotalea aquiviva TaxID=3242415 RepID=UPI00352A1D29
MHYLTGLESFIKNSQAYPYKPYLHQPINGQWQTLTFSEVEQQARCIASGLLAQGFEVGDKIGILSKNCAQWFIADLAIMMAGMISVPIYATAGKKTISYVVNHSQMKAIFVGKLDELNPAEQGLPKDLLTISFPYPSLETEQKWDEWLEQYPPVSHLHQASLDDCMSIVYTSGTTGEPKGAVISYKNLASAAYHTAHVIAQNNQDRVLSYLPLAHITERCVVEATSFCSGAQVFFVESLDSFLDDLKHASPTIFLSVPRLWAKFHAQILQRLPQKKLNILLKIPFLGRLIAAVIRKNLGLSKTKIFASGSAPISKSLLTWYHKIGIDICEGWGMTETSGLSCGNIPYQLERMGTIGEPIPCVKMKLSEQQEILIKGDSVFKQYYLKPGITEKSFQDGWFKTGDLGRQRSDGAYEIIGRVKEQFKTSKGKYVSPVPIEGKLGQNGHIEQVCIMGSGLKQPVALVVLGESVNRQSNDVLKSLDKTLSEVNKELERHQKVDFIFVCKEPWSIENDMLTPTLKLKRDQIEAHYSALLPLEPNETVIVE